MKTIKALAIAFVVSSAIVTGTWAQQGPVASACKEDIAKFCADKEHGEGEVRACLEANKDKVASTCNTALETTGGGR